MLGAQPGARPLQIGACPWYSQDVHDYRRLDVWHRSRIFVLDIYRVTIGFPLEERFGLTSQLRRAVVSIPANIAEGAGRGTRGDFARFIRVAIGSACEVETQLDLSFDLELIPDNDHKSLLGELGDIKAMLRGLERSLMS